jgi:hypothetical protein
MNDPNPHPVVQARRARLYRLRRSVAAVAVSVFLALFATIYVQMATGHDPALASSQTSAVVATAGDDEDPVEQAAQAETPAEPSAVTTQQS